MAAQAARVAALVAALLLLAAPVSAQYGYYYGGYGGGYGMRRLLSIDDDLSAATNAIPARLRVPPLHASRRQLFAAGENSWAARHVDTDELLDAPVRRRALLQAGYGYGGYGYGGYY